MLSIPGGLSTTTTSRSRNTIALSGRTPVRSLGACSSTITSAPGGTRDAGSRQRWPFTVTRPCVHSVRARDHAAPVCWRTTAATVGSTGRALGAGCARRSIVPPSASTTPGFAQRRVQLVDIGLDLLPAPFVDELPPSHVPRVGQAHAGRGQVALHVVDAFAEHDLYAVGALAVDHHVQRLAGFRYAYLDLLWVDGILKRAVHRGSERSSCRGAPARSSRRARGFRS